MVFGFVSFWVVLSALVSAENEAHLLFVALGVIFPALVSAENEAHSALFVVLAFGVVLQALVSTENEAHLLSKVVVVVALGVPGMVLAETNRLLFFGSPFVPSSVGLVGTSRGEVLVVDTMAVVVC